MADSNIEPAAEGQPRPLSAGDAAQLAARVAEISAAELPLAPGLRAAADELADGRLAQSLKSLAAALERGQPLEQALLDEQLRLPASFRGLVAAGVRSGRLGEVLEQFVSFRQFVADLRRQVWLALAYPLMLLAITGALFLFVVVELTPLLADVYGQMADEPVFSPITHTMMPPSKPREPANLQMLQWLAANLSIWLPAAIVVVLAFAAVFRFRNAPRLRRILNRMPAIGPLWRLSGMAEFTRLLRLLVEHEIPLPQSLRLAADGIGDADVAAGCRRLAERVESGQSLSAALDGLPQFTPIERSLIAWGESHGSLAAALETTADACVRRLRVWSELLRGVLPEIMLLVIAAGVLTIVSFFRAIFSTAIALMSYNGAPGGRDALSFGEPAGAFSLALIAVALLISLRLTSSRRLPGGDMLQTLLQILARVLLAYAAFGFFICIAGDLGVFLWFGALIVWGIVVFRFRRSQQQMLVDLLSLAARRGLPLAPAVQAFSEEQPGAIGRRAAAFAERLDSGYPLADAIFATRRLLPRQDQLAIEIAQRTDSLPLTLQNLSSDTGSPERYKETVGVGAIGLLAVMTIGAACVLFIGFKVGPAFFRIFADFHRPLPPLTRGLFSVLGTIEGPGLPLAILFIAGLVVFGFHFASYEMGWIRAEFPLVNRLLAPRHSALLLRWFAAAVRRDQPLWPLHRAAAERYPNRLIRRRLRRSAVDIEQGGDWIASFRRRRLIGRTDSAILRAASRAGNLAWALEESATAAQRRLAYRLQTISQILMPLAVLLAGACVMLITVGLLLPLVELITDLAK